MNVRLVAIIHIPFGTALKIQYYINVIYYYLHVCNIIAINTLNCPVANYAKNIMLPHCVYRIEDLLRRVILDVDSGIDDVIAILVALRSRNICVVGISTVNGNVNPNIGMSNVLKALEIENRLNIPVFQGARRSLRNRSQSSKMKIGREVSHGRRGLGNLVLNDKKMNKLWNRITPDALKGTHTYSDFIEFILQKYPDDNISIIATGPLTNIATMVMKESESQQRRIKEISIMGGLYREAGKPTGDIERSVEFNFYSDPEAAKIVLNAKHRFMIRIVGLDITQNPKCSISKDLVKRICSTNGHGRSPSEASKFLSSLLDYKLERNTVLYLHDVLAVFMLEEPSLFRFVKGEVEILTAEGSERGLSIFKKDSGRVSLAIYVNGSKFRRLLLSRLRRI